MWIYHYRLKPRFHWNTIKEIGDGKKEPERRVLNKKEI